MSPVLPPGSRRSRAAAVGLATAAAIYLAAGLHPWQWSPPQRFPNHASRSGAGIRFDGPGIALGAGDDAWVGEARRRGEAAVLLRVRSFSPSQRGPARIFTLSRDASHRSLTIGQVGDDLVVRLRTAETTLNGMPERVVPDVFSRPEWRVIEVAVGEGLLRVLVDGREGLREALPARALESWDASHRVALGNEHNGLRPWLGEIAAASVRSGGAARGYLLPGESRLPAAYWAGNRPLLVPFRAFDRSRVGLLDLAVNLVGFLPLALIATLALGSRALAVLACAAVSITIESAQLFFEDRFSSATDFVLNLAGAVLGASFVPARRRRSGLTP
ncbi:MAG TPA: VanZ family protein [Planctomycetota bacterium]|nr:VanZ family protein [Planctomycetota bacterium]